MALSFHRAHTRWRQLAHTLTSFPWRNTAHTLSARFREDRLGLTASSLTFTTLLALVPFVAVALAVFTAFPTFGRLQLTLQRWLIDSLIPDAIAQQVMDYLMQFAAKASQLGGVGFGVLLITVISLILTVDRTLNNIWRVQRMRSLGQRLLIYWAVITLGPLMMGGSIATTSYVLYASRGLVAALPEVVQVGFNSLEFLLLSGAMAALYHYVPNTAVKWRHAFAGGLFVAIGMALAKKVLALYLASVPTYSAIYGTFATVPIFLVWIYVGWVIFLLGAVVTAYLPSLLAGMARHSSHRGWSFELALEVVAVLEEQRLQPGRGMPALALARRLRVDALQLEPALAALTAVRWLGMLPDEGQTRALDDREARYVLLCDPNTTPLSPLLQHLLLERTPSTEPLWQQGHWDQLTLRQALPAPAPDLPIPAPVLALAEPRSLWQARRAQREHEAKERHHGKQ